MAHDPQYCLELFKSTAPLHVPHWLFAHVCVPVLQLPQLRVAPFWHGTQSPVLARHSGVAPEQALSATHVPPWHSSGTLALRQRRVLAAGSQALHSLPTHCGVEPEQVSLV